MPQSGNTEDDLTGSSYKLKNKLKKNMKLVFHKKLTEAAEDKSKMKYYMEGIKTGSQAKEQITFTNSLETEPALSSRPELECSK